MGGRDDGKHRRRLGILDVDVADRPRLNVKPITSGATNPATCPPKLIISTPVPTRRCGRILVGSANAVANTNDLKK
jgi:hypothetical protein